MGLRLLRRVKALWLLLALLAFAFQNAALGGHIHPHAPRHGATMARIATDISTDSGDDGDHCPLCQAQQWLGQPLLPGEVLFLPKPTGDNYLFAVAIAGLSGHRRSHDWHSRAPPLNT